MRYSWNWHSVSHNISHVLRHRRCECQLFSTDGMLKGHFIGVECLTVNPAHIRVIQIIADERITNIFHMNTNLMGTAGFQMKRKQAVPIFTFLDLVMRNGRLTIFKINGSFNNGAGFSAKRRSDCSAVRHIVSFDDSQIFPVNFMTDSHIKKYSGAQ